MNNNVDNVQATAQMVIDIHDYSVVDDLKHLLAHINGIGKISVRKNYYESEDFYKDLEASEADIAEGKGTRIESKEDLDALFL